MNRDEYEQMYRLEDRHWWFLARRNLLTMALDRYLHTLPPTEGGTPRRLIDVGCGTGGTLDRLAWYGDAFGLDLEPLALAHSRERGHTRLVYGSATALPFASASFDVAVALDVLEHIPDHAAAAREVARVLRPGGLFFASVPAYPSLWSRHDLALMHQRRYVAPELDELLRGAGLTVEWRTFSVCSLLPIVYLVRRAQRFARAGGPPRADVAPTPAPLNAALRGLLDVESRAILRVPAPCGVSLFAVARKPADGAQ